MDVLLRWSRLKLRCFLLITCLFSSSSSLVASPLPPPFKAQFSGSKYLFFSLDSRIQLQHIGQYLKYTLITEGSILVYSNRLYDCSVMQLGPHGLLPLEHKHTDQKNPEYDAHTVFNWEERVAHVKTDYGGKSGEFKIDPSKPVWDPMSLQIRIMIDTMSGKLTNPRLYQLLEYRELSSWPIAIQGDEKLDTDYGTIDTVIVQRTDGKSFKLWLAKDFGFVPAMVELDKARISMTQDPDTITQSAEQPAEEQPHC